MNRIFLIMLVLLLSSCNSKKPRTFNRKMAEVVRDINIAEAALQGTKGSTRDSLFKLYYRQVFTLHHVTEDEFYRYMDSLRNDPEMAEETYEFIKTEMEKEAKEDKIK